MIKILFLDVGGVMLTNGWDHLMRDKAYSLFKLDKNEIESKHKEFFPQHEEGRITLDEYLTQVIFFRQRDFSREEFRDFIFKQSLPLEGMRELFREIKEKYKLKIAIVSNEGRDLALYRTTTFGIDLLADYFFYSSFIHVRKPDLRMYQIALDVTLSEPQNTLYIDDRKHLVETAERIGINSIIHKNRENTRQHMIEIIEKSLERQLKDL
ncbi:MAG: HAD family phosphatase [Chlamydiales bacterium]